MYYKSEIFVNGKMKYQSVEKASNPQKVVRRAARKVKYPFVNIYVMNRDGDIWEYSTQMNKSKIEVVKTAKTKRILPVDVLNKIFAGNMSIIGVI